MSFATWQDQLSNLTKVSESMECDVEAIEGTKKQRQKALAALEAVPGPKLARFSAIEDAIAESKAKALTITETAQQLSTACQDAVVMPVGMPEPTPGSGRPPPTSEHDREDRERSPHRQALTAEGGGSIEALAREGQTHGGPLRNA